ncbi:NADH dehydrogenase [ubiquinone] 1 alpha subcomplex assembly factor 3 [Microtus ochrogaster]|uniref:NADH dehydrogenase [ubiquinone] 1 alpha subcomplex assembly factor 3 n=1 Tax=Microtus ochrogaster TaxID=79684 RepID=A0A8J6L4C5_MICOH|nr:NADH dehydrogenase [ubiquinone] 1 alpha subcomplex assembly factor 3 [Microtus ochrogaster]
MRTEFWEEESPFLCSPDPSTKEARCDCLAEKGTLSKSSTNVAFPNKVGPHQDITEERFSLFWMLEPRIEIVVVGTGNETERLHPQVLQAMRQRGIAVEVQDTPNACATFNFLCHEGRVTGAALIPLPGETILPSLGQATE